MVNGERSLGRLYRKGALATVRREWRGVVDTAYDFYEWARMWGMFLGTFSKDLLPSLNATLYYRWMAVFHTTTTEGRSAVIDYYFDYQVEHPMTMMPTKGNTI